MLCDGQKCSFFENKFQLWATRERLSGYVGWQAVRISKGDPKFKCCA
jgi:hypothetical protein